MGNNKDRISFVTNATTKEALVYSILTQACSFATYGEQLMDLRTDGHGRS